MPNWSYNTVALQGKKEAVHKFIKIGLNNSGLESTNDIMKDFDLLKAEGKTKTVKNEVHGNKSEVGEIEMETYLSARTFLPMPDTFLLYDTTNYPNAYPVAVVKEQKEKYGAIGWYDYNCLTLGTKWNFKLGENDEPSIDTIDGHDDCYRIVFTCDTAWSMPIAWLCAIKNLVPELGVFIMSNEESGQWYMCGYIDENGELCDYSDLTDEMDNLYKTWDDSRKEAEKKIRSDVAKMTEIKASVLENNKDKKLTDDELQQKIDWEVEGLVDEECGDYYNDCEVFEKLDLAFYNMINEMI